MTDKTNPEGALAAQLVPLDTAIQQLQEQKDGAYLERNRCVAALARMAIALGQRAGRAKTAIDGWDPAWHGCIYIDLPTGQVSWHYHESQSGLFTGLPEYAGRWDGHDTPTKYERLAAAFPVLAAAPQAPAAQQVPTNHRRVSVDVGVLQMVRNALSRDAEEGRIVRGEMLEELEKSIAMLAAAPQAPRELSDSDTRPWNDADSDAARLALELECLLLSIDDAAIVARWWDSANEALAMHRNRLAAAAAKGE